MVAAERRLRGSRSFQQPEAQLISQRALGSRRSSVVEDQLSPASLRRLSWRRHVLARGALLNDQIGQSKGLDKRSRRRLASIGGTYSVGDNSDSNKSTILERWIRESANEKQSNLIESNHTVDRHSSWSKSSLRRGKYGESLVHILIVQQTNEHLILLVCLIHLYPRLALDVFESFKFKGLSCLHLAIAYGNERLLAYLVTHLSQLEGVKYSVDNQRVTGSLFRSPAITRAGQPSNSGGDKTLGSNLIDKLLRKPFNQKQRVNPVREDGQSGLDSAQYTGDYWCDRMDHWPTANGCNHLLLFNGIHCTTSVGEVEKCEWAPGKQLPIYLGDTPLAWTVSFGARSMYELLVAKAEADQDTQDSQGDTCLHQLVINNQPGWVRFLVKSGSSQTVENSLGLTPILFACHLGRYKLFNEFLELSAVEFWSYSMISCCGYPLTSLDSINLEQTSGPDRGARSNKSAMAVILESEVSDNEQKSQLLSSAVVKKLLEEKWRIFAKRLFYNEFFLALLHLLLLTLAISLKPQHLSSDQVGSIKSMASSSPTGITSIKNTSFGTRQQIDAIATLLDVTDHSLKWIAANRQQLVSF